MSYCINPFCTQRQNSDDTTTCSNCGTPLLINNRIRLLRPLRPLEDQFRHTEIFEVEDTGTKWHPVREIRILKVLKWAEPTLVELIQRESLALQVLNHPGIPMSSIDDYFTFTPNNSSLKLHCLVMQKIEGENLESWIEKNEPISESMAQDFLKQLVSILDVVHRSTFFHRDIKPENIIIKDNNQLALVDFGGVRQITGTYLVKVGVNGGTETGLGMQHKTTILGTPGYSPLEQINGQTVPQSDFYALGRTMVRLITGKDLINFKTDPQTGKLIWRQSLPHIGAETANLLDEMMSPFPGGRPQNCQILLHRLERLPLQSKLNRIVKGKPFKISAVILSLLAILGVYNGARPLIANYLISQGKKAELESRFVDAQENFATGIRLRKKATYSVSRFYFDLASRNESRPEVAKKYYESSIKFNPQDVDAYNNLALTCQQLRDNECVKRSYLSALKLTDNNWSSHYGLGSFYDQQGEYSLAVQQYELAIKKGGSNAVGAMSNLSRLKNRSGEYKEAEKLAQQGLQGLQIQKTDSSIHKAALIKNLGWAKLGQQANASASTYLQTAIELDSLRADAYCLLAQAQEKLGQIRDTKLSIEACLYLNSSLPEVQTWRQQILQRLLH